MEQSKQPDKPIEGRVEALELAVDVLGMQVEKPDRLVYKRFKRLPRRVETTEEAR